MLSIVQFVSLFPPVTSQYDSPKWKYFDSSFVIVIKNIVLQKCRSLIFFFPPSDLFNINVNAFCGVEEQVLY